MTARQTDVMVSRAAAVAACRLEVARTVLRRRERLRRGEQPGDPGSELFSGWSTDASKLTSWPSVVLDEAADALHRQADAERVVAVRQLQRQSAELARRAAVSARGRESERRPS